MPTRSEAIPLDGAAVGFSPHSGWAAAVVLAGTVAKPVMVDRRRFVLAEPDDPVGGLSGKDPKPLGSLAAILASHALIHAAQGEMYRDVLREAAQSVPIALVHVPERDAEARCAKAVGLPAERLHAHLADLAARRVRPGRRT